MKNIFYWGAYICFLFLGSSSVMGQGFLRVKDTHIENDHNKNFIIRSVGLGGWMLQEGYMYQLGFLGQQYKIHEKISSLIGADAAKKFYDKWLKGQTQKEDIDSLASWGFNAIRLPMHYRLFTLPIDLEPNPAKNTWLPKGFEMVDSLLAWCEKDHIYLILDLHAAPGGQGNDLPISDRNPDEPSLWQSQKNQNKTVALWHELAKRYKDRSYIGGYDILNETNWGFTDSTDVRGTKEMKNIPLRDLFIRITKAIRQVDKKHIIFLEGNGFANNYNGMFPLWDKNLVVSFHKYGNFSEQKTIQQFLDIRNTQKVPLWLGESGENSNTWYTNTIALMEKNDIGWSWWPLKKMGNNNPLEVKMPKDYAMFVDYCNGKLASIDKNKANSILDELLANIKIQNNIYHKDVVDAMIRQIKDKSTRPFKNNVVSKQAEIQAADYDLGGNRYAYFDRDTASYMYTPGIHTQGNRGRFYRNDGVDIKSGTTGEPNVFHIEDGEWLKYTLQVVKEGNYELSFQILDYSDTSKIRVIINGKQVATYETKLNEAIEAGIHIHLNKGRQELKMLFEKGGFDFKSFELKRKN